MKTLREVALEAALEEARATNKCLHRRVQQAEARSPGLRSRGRARLAADCVRSTDALAQTLISLGTIRAIAAGWGRQTYPPHELMEQALRDIEAEASKSLAAQLPASEDTE